MASIPPQSSSPISGDDRNLVVVDESYLALTFEDRLRMFWERHGSTVLAALALVILFFAARYLFGLYAEHRENQVRAAYAEAGDDLAALRAFATDNPAAELAGLAWVRLADAAYQKGDFAASAEAYAEASKLLTEDPIGDRALMGRAVSLLKSNASNALAEFEKLANDTAFPASLRAEAAYHLGVIAKDSSRSEDASRWLALAASVDSSGLWAQRATQLMESIPVQPAGESPVQESPAQTEAAPVVTFPGSTK